MYQSQSDFVSQLKGFAVLAPDQTPLAIGGKLTPADLAALLGQADNKAALAQSVGDGAVVAASLPGDSHLRLAFVPAIGPRQGRPRLRLRGGSDGGCRAHQSRADRCHADDQPVDRHGLLRARRHRLAAHPRALARRGPDPLPRHARFADRPAQSASAAPASRSRRRSLQAAWPPDGGVLPRPRSLQGRQRYARPPDWRCVARRSLGPPAGRACARSILSAAWAAMSSPSSAEDLEAPEDAMRLARRVCTALGETYHVNGHEVTIRVDRHRHRPARQPRRRETLLKNADLALYRAKEDGRNTFRFFEPAMDAALQKRRRLENDLRNALRKNQLYLDYQPQFDLVSGRLTGYEALVRWWHPSEGEISPTTFIPIAEETGLIVPLGEWILKTACAYATTWPDDTKLAVNLSPAQFKTQDIYGLVRRVLSETGLRAAAARARDHRRHHPPEHRRGPRYAHPPRPARRIDRHGRFRHRLFQPFLPHPLPGQEDQDRSLLHRYARHQPADLGHRLEHRRPRPVAQRDDHRRGGGDGRPSRDAEEVGLRSSAGLLLRQARRGRAGISKKRPQDQPQVA